LKFSHVVAKGGNIESRLALHQRPISEIRFKDKTKSIFNYKVKNDTLYIDFDEKFTKPYLNNWSETNQVIVLFDSIASFSYTNSQNFIYGKKITHLKITSKGTNHSLIQFEKIDTLEIYTHGKTKMRSNSSRVNHLKIRAKDQSDIKLRTLTDTEDIDFTEDATVKIY